MITALFIVLLLAIFGVIPVWPHSHNWGWAPPGILTVFLVVLAIVWLARRTG